MSAKQLVSQLFTLDNRKHDTCVSGHCACYRVTHMEVGKFQTNFEFIESGDTEVSWSRLAVLAAFRRHTGGTQEALEDTNLPKSVGPKA